MRDVKCVVFGNAGELKPADAGIWRDADQFRTDPPLTLTPASGALGQAGDGGDQDRAEHKAHDTKGGEQDALPPVEALAFWGR